MVVDMYVYEMYITNEDSDISTRSVARYTYAQSARWASDVRDCAF